MKLTKKEIAEQMSRDAAECIRRKYVNDGIDPVTQTKEVVAKIHPAGPRWNAHAWSAGVEYRDGREIAIVVEVPVADCEDLSDADKEDIRKAIHDAVGAITI